MASAPATPCAEGGIGRDGHGFDRAEEHVLRQADKGCAQGRLGALAEGVDNGFWNAVAVIDLDGVLGHGLHDTHIVQTLVGLDVAQAAAHIPAQGHQRIAVIGRGGQARDQIRDSRTRRDQADARRPGQQTVHARHEGGVLLMAAEDQLRAVVCQHIKNRIHLGAGNAKDVLDPLRFQALHQQFRTVSGSGHTLCLPSL